MSKKNNNKTQHAPAAATKPHGNGNNQNVWKMPAAKPKKSGAMAKLWQWASTFVPYLAIAVTLVMVGSSLISNESEVLYRSQELSLWVPGEQYQSTLTIYPGGWLSWLGCYMTQYFFNPATGVWLMVLCWAAIVGLSLLLFRLKGWKVLLTLLVPLMLLACLTQTGYWLYYQKLPGHLWVPTLGVLINVVAALVVRTMLTLGKKESLLRKAGTLAAIVLTATYAWYGYQLLGVWTFLGLALMAMPLLTIEKNDNKPYSWPKLIRAIGGLPVIVLIIIAVAGIIFVPKMCYAWVFEQTNPSTIYRAGMPCFWYGPVEFSEFRTAYILLLLSFPALLGAQWWQAYCLYAKTDEKNVFAVGSKWANIMGGVVILLLLFIGVKFTRERWYGDRNFHDEVAMSNAVEREDWQAVLDISRQRASDTIQCTRAMVMLKNLALFRLGRAGEEMFLYPEGAQQYCLCGRQTETIKKPAEAGKEERDSIVHVGYPDDRADHNCSPTRITQIAGKLVYYNYGKLNFCYRWCMEDGVEFGWHVEELKYMAKCALLKHEDVVARKLLNILKQTRYHKAWAERYLALVGQSDEQLKKENELNHICFLKEYGDRLDGDNTLVEIYLLQTFANGHGADPVYQEMTLLAAMQMKDIDLFWPRFAEYAHRHSKEEGFHMPRYYQEAAYLYCMLEPQRPSIFAPNHTNAEVVETLPFDQSTKDKYANFMSFNGMPSIAGLSEAEKAKAFKPQYGDTFYYFYFLVRNQKTN